MLGLQDDTRGVLFLNISFWWQTFVSRCVPVGINQAKIERTKWWKLKGETSEVFRERVIKEGTWKEKEDINNMWKKMATNIRKVTSEVCGVTKGSGGEAKDTWWWNEEVQRAIKEKKEYYRRLYHDRSVNNIEKYKVAKKTA